MRLKIDMNWNHFIDSVEMLNHAAKTWAFEYLFAKLHWIVKLWGADAPSKLEAFKADPAGTYLGFEEGVQRDIWDLARRDWEADVAPDRKEIPA